jgi:hypothetical protein
MANTTAGGPFEAQPRPAERDLMCRRLEVKTKRSASTSKRVKLKVGCCGDLMLAI